MTDASSRESADGAPPSWASTPLCRDRAVYSPEGERIARAERIVAPPDESGDVFCILLLGSVSRLGNDARAVPVRLLAEIEGDGLRLLCDPKLVRSAPLHIEGRRCACCDWFDRVRAHFGVVSAEGAGSRRPE